MNDFVHNCVMECNDFDVIFVIVNRDCKVVKLLDLDVNKIIDCDSNHCVPFS